MYLRAFIGAALATGLAAASQAITFSNFGVPVGTVDGNHTLQGLNGIHFSLSDMTKIGIGSKAATLSFTVAADAGYSLTSFDIIPTGLIRNYASANVDTYSSPVWWGVPTTHDFLYQSIGAGSAGLGSASGYGLAPKSAYNVSLDVTVAGTMRSSIASLTQLTLVYHETPAVPEPASMAVIGMGLAGLIARRIRRKN